MLALLSGTQKLQDQHMPDTSSLVKKQALLQSYPLLGLCTGILVASLLSAFVAGSLVVSSLEKRSAQYGQALADLAARQAMDATLNHDLVSLQVILSDIVESPNVSSASIHDVENNLLVQAGDARPQGRARSSFTAAIALHNSIAGYVTVNLDFSSDQSLRYQLYWLFGFTAVLIIALTLSALYFGRGLAMTLPRPAIPIINAMPKRNARDSEEDDEGEDAAESRSLLPSFPRVELIIHFHNLRELAAQLDHHAFRSISQRIDEQFRSVLALYQGQLIQFDGNEARLAFARAHSNPAAAFQAICSARLLLTLNARSKPFSLDVSALIIQRDSDSAILKNLQFQLAELDDYRQMLQGSESGTLLMESRLIDEDLDSKVQQKPVDDFADLVEILQLSEQYQQLLERQLAQLQRS